MTLISPEYLETQRWLHAQPRGYGGGGWKHAVKVAAMAGRLGCRTVLDYGCGQGTLSSALRDGCPELQVREYDPAIAGKDGRPAPADLVVCTDVLEHVEPQHLREVLQDIRSLARRAIYLVIATRPANKFLPDGRNAHLTVRDSTWWSDMLSAWLAPYGVRTLAGRNGGEIAVEVRV